MANSCAEGVYVLIIFDEKEHNMEREVLQKELYMIINNGDDALLETLHEVAKEYDDNIVLSEEKLKELDARRTRYLSGDSKSYTWEEVKEIVRQKKKVK